MILLIIITGIDSFRSFFDQVVYMAMDTFSVVEEEAKYNKSFHCWRKCAKLLVP